jgi:hypothetical protein
MSSVVHHTHLLSKMTGDKAIATVLLAVALASILSLAMLSEPSEASSSGTWGGNLSWTLDNGGNLVISGSGPMENCEPGSPWGTDVVTVEIKEGVTSISTMAFYDCDKLVSISIPGSVSTIEAAAFAGCESLKSIVLPDALTEISESLLSGCASLESVIIPASVLGRGFLSKHRKVNDS